MKFKTNNGKIFEAQNYAQAAHSLWQMMLIPEPNLTAWMQASAKRAYAWNNSVISINSPDEHIKDLLKAGLLELIE